MVSNCNSNSAREAYVEELQKYIPVDVIGKCGNTTVCRSYKESGDGCHMKLSSLYKFYLSFENSICYDYVTEKFTRALKMPIVPVAMGGANYTAFAPNNSFIDEFDFESPKELAHYLLYLDKHNVWVFSIFPRFTFSPLKVYKL